MKRIKAYQWTWLIALLLIVSSLAIQLWMNKGNFLDITRYVIEKHIDEQQQLIDNYFLDTRDIFSKSSLPEFSKLLSVSTELEDNKISVFVFKPDDSLYFWSSQKTKIDNPQYFFNSNQNFIKLYNRYYTVFKYNYPNGYKAIALGLIYQKYPYSNQFFQQGFVFNRHLLFNTGILSGVEHHKFFRNIYLNDKEVLFSIIPYNVNGSFGFYFVFLIYLAGMLLFFYGTATYVKILLEQTERKKSVIAIIIMIAIAEIFFYLLHFQFGAESKIFSPHIYASRLFGGDLAGMFLHIALIFWVASILYKYFVPSIHFTKSYQAIIASMLSGVLYNILILLHRSLVLDSTLSFSVYDINNINPYIIIIFAATGLALTSFYFILFIVYQAIDEKKNFWIPLILTVVTGLLIQYFIFQDDIVLYIFLLSWLILLSIIIHEESEKSIENQNYWLLTRMLTVAAFAFFSAILFYNVSISKEEDNNRLLLKELASERDFASEFSLIETTYKISKDKKLIYFFQHPYMLGKKSDKDFNITYFKSFSDDYDVETFLYNRYNIPVKGIYKKSFSYFEQLIASRTTLHIDSGLYYSPISKEGEKYIVFVPITKDSMDTLGYFISVLKPEFINTFSAYPTLLKPDKSAFDEDFVTNSYAVYGNGILAYNKGMYVYPNVFSFKRNKDKKFALDYQNNYKHYIYNKKDKQVVYSVEEISNLSKISIFSYLFLFYILLQFLSDALNQLHAFWKYYFTKRAPQSDSLQMQIELSIISIVLLSLVVLSIMGLFYLRYQYADNHAKKVKTQVSKFINLLHIDYERLYPEYGAATFEYLYRNELKNRAAIEDFDINIYNISGDLEYTTQPEIFNLRFFSNKINPHAYQSLFYKKSYQFSAIEDLDKLKYQSEYIIFTDDTKKVLGYFNFPYFGKLAELKKDISVFLVALVNVYVIMLIMAVYASVYIARRITKPLEIIKKHISEFRFGKAYTPIAWHTNDEIKLLVDQYNSTLAILADSADKLAKSERESAWREMAKQVAHEIKNPLTPMKLSIQLLQKKLLADDSDEVKDFVKTLSVRLIEQIDALTDIATAFSDFAKMPQGTYEAVRIKDVVLAAADVFMQQEDIVIEIQNSASDLWVWADRGQLVRVYNNLIKNALQALVDVQEPKIEIQIYNDSDNIIVAIKDNGTGIDKDKKKHIFEPNFTTKSSGSGLGLAMSKSIIEQCRGKIWFEDNKPLGTIFYTQLPIYDYKN
jgi:signal transduction histidine kinase